MNIFILLICFLKVSNPLDYYSFRVCGNYCGPGWCNGKWLDEGLCDESAPPESTHPESTHPESTHPESTHPESTHPEFNNNEYSCSDYCCKKHDNCCGQNKSLQLSCNTQIVNCLSKCNKFSLTCTNRGIPIPAGIIKYSMSIIENWCCGTRCN